jgi:hypothetical protein
MNGTLAQLIALVSYGNAYLNGAYVPQNFYPDNSTFKFCNAVTFVEVKKFLQVTETEFAVDPNEWFSRLKGLGCRRLSLRYTPTPNPQLPDYLSVAFVGGGGKWHIAAIFSNSADRWLSRWQVTDQNAPDNRIWKVDYGRVSKNEPLPELSDGELSSCKDRFERVLKQIEAFAVGHNLEHFAKCFQKGIDSLSTDDPTSFGYAEGLLPNEGFSLEAKQLIAGTSAAWVFGGMGSWNDLGFDGDEQSKYERLSKDLYSIMNESVEQSANSYGSDS